MKQRDGTHHMQYTVGGIPSLFSLTRFFVVLTIMFAWVFSGWPPVWHAPIFPPKIQEAQAATQAFSTPGTDTFTVPSGVTTITVKTWGAGGGGGGGSTGAGAAGAGGGFSAADISVTPDETLNISVGGGGGGGGGASQSGAGGAGGGHSGVFRGTITQANALIIAGAGGGGGGGDNGSGIDGGAGGAGGGNTGGSGANAQGTVTGGGGGTQSAGGAVGTGDDATGTGGSALAGGVGDAHDSGVVGGTGGTNGGGAGGNASSGSRGGGGGGGAGYYGGGGGGGANAASVANAGGGGGSNFLTGSSQTNTQASGQTGAGQGDGDYPGGVGDGGAGGTSNGTGTAGENGYVLIIWTVSNQSPAAPTLHDVPFDNERTGDSTPDFEFTANDPDGTADIIYQIQIDDDYAFGSALVNCESDTSCAAGGGSFSNTVSGGDTSPFNEGERIRFTPTTAMTTGTTYYWRVRAEDASGSGGSGSYGNWTSVQSITFTSGTDPVEWFQTTDEQFDTGTLTDTQTTGSDSVELPGSSTTNWGDDTQQGTATNVNSWLRCMRGTSPNTSGMTLTGVFFSSGGSGNVRVAVYQGGTSDTDPTGATLTWDAGEVTAGTGFVGATGGTASLSANTRTWICVKGNDNTVNVHYDTSWDSSSDFVSATGRWADGSGESTDETVAYPSTLDGTGGSTSAFWYSFYLTYEVTTSPGTIMSTESDFDWVSGQNSWDEVRFSTTETNGDVKVSVYYTASTACDTIVPDGALSGNSSGFDVSASPVDISGLNTGTYNRLCLQATLTDSGGTPFLNDWTISWLAGNTLPSASAVSIDSDAAAATLTEGTTTNVVCAGTVTDTNGFSDIAAVGAFLFRTSVGTSSPYDANNQYSVYGDTACVPSNGSGNSEDYTCTVAVEYYADPTDAGSPNASDDWTCELWPEDATATGTPATDTIEVNSLIALEVTTAINYGTLDPDTDSGGTNQTTTITNTGNRDMDPELSGTNMTSGGDTLAVSQQKYSATAFTYSSGGTALSTTPTTFNLTLPQRTGGVVTDDVLWGIGIPDGTPSGTYTGSNTVTAVNGL